MADRTITDKTRKLLWWCSGQRCAFPGCDVPLVHVDATSGASTIVGKECHIIAQRDAPTVARAPCTLSDEEVSRYSHLIEHRHSAENLILLCGRHSDIIDDPQQDYSVADVLAIKRDHMLAHQSSSTLAELPMIVSEVEALMCRRSPIAPDALRFPVESGNTAAMVNADNARQLATVTDELGSLGCITGEPGSGKSMFLYALVRHLGLQAIEGEGQLHPMLLRASTLPSGTSVLQAVHALRAALAHTSEVVLIVDDLDQVDNAERIFAEAITASQAQIARVIFACLPDSALLRHDALVSAPRITIRSLSLTEAEELASALVTASDPSEPQATSEALEMVRAALPRRPLYIELACAGVKQDPDGPPGRSAASILRATVYAATLPPRPGSHDPSTAALLAEVGGASWGSAMISDAGFRRIPAVLDDPDVAAQAPRVRALLRPGSLGALRWRHTGLAPLAVAWWLSNLRPVEIANLCGSQSIGNPRLAMALQLGLAWSTSRDEALAHFLGDNSAPSSDIALHQSDFCRLLATWTVPDEWSPASRALIGAVLVRLCRIEGPSVLAHLAHWASVAPLLKGLKKAIRRKSGTEIAAAVANSNAFAELREPALARLRKSLGPSANAEVALALHAAGDEPDRERAEEHFLTRAIDDEEHPNARVHALRHLGDYASTRSSAVSRLKTVVASETSDGIRFRAAGTLCKAGNQHLETLAEQAQGDYTKAIVGLTLAFNGDNQQRRVGWDIVRTLSSAAQDTRATTLCAEVLEQRPGQEQPRRRRTITADSSSSSFASARTTVVAVRAASDLHEARDLVDKLTVNESIGMRTRQHALRIVALDQSVADWARLGAAAGLLAINGDPKAAEQALNEIIRRAHPITAANAATVLRGMGANEDIVVQRFADVGKEFFFHRVAASVLSRTQGLDAFNAVAAIVKRHRQSDLIPFLRDSMALLFPIASEAEWQYALRRAQRVTAAATRHA